MRYVLRPDRPSKPAAWDLLPAALDRVLRRPLFGARHRVVDRRFAGAPRVPGAGPRRADAGAFDDLRTRRLLDLETHRAVFTWILQVLATANLVKGTTIGGDGPRLPHRQRATAIGRPSTTAARTRGRALPRPLSNPGSKNLFGFFKLAQTVHPKPGHGSEILADDRSAVFSLCKNPKMNKPTACTYLLGCIYMLSIIWVCAVFTR